MNSRMRILRIKEMVSCVVLFQFHLERYYSAASRVVTPFLYIYQHAVAETRMPNVGCLFYKILCINHLSVVYKFLASCSHIKDLVITTTIHKQAQFVSFTGFRKNKLKNVA